VVDLAPVVTVVETVDEDVGAAVADVEAGRVRRRNGNQSQSLGGW